VGAVAKAVLLVWENMSWQEPFPDGRGVGMESPEIQRIRRVYADYERDGRWSQFGPGRARMSSERYENVSSFLKANYGRPLHGCRILDIGCGGGELLAWFHEQGADPANLVGVDLLPNRIEAARRRFPAFTFLEANAEKLDFPDSSFDLVAVFTVFSSILECSTSRKIAKSIVRVLKPGGAVIWYDLRYPNPSNPNVRAMTMHRISELFPGLELKLKSITLLPPIAGRLTRRTISLYPILTKLPFLRSHYVGLLTRSELGKR
jgi:ubiquinone/menaquinone biosynthesis C-methylase UbiE